MYVVTGASSGIGRAVSLALAARGADVIAVARSADGLEELRREAPDRVVPVVADVTTDAARVAEAIVAQGWPRVAGMVHSAGSLVALEPYVAVDAADLVDHFRVHVAAPIGLFQQIARHRSVARMLFIDSYSASGPRPGWPAYSIVKAAAQMAARAAAVELTSTKVLRVFPGAVRTRIVDQVLGSGGETAKAFAEMAGRGELSEPSDAAEFIVRLLVDTSDGTLAAREAWDYNNPEDRALVG